MDKRQNDLISQFVKLFNNDIKQRDKKWFELTGTTVGGSELASIMGMSPYSDLYKVVQNKIDNINGVKQPQFLACWWGTVFENIIEKVVELDLGNKIMGSNICIQKYEGHRTSPDGYVVAKFYEDEDGYFIWTTDMPKSIISLSLIMILEFKCPITRKPSNNIPNHYLPQVLSGIDVSPIANKGLFIDSIFRKCSMSQLGINRYYDISYHTKKEKLNLPICYGYLYIYSSIDMVKEIENICDENDESINLDFELLDIGDCGYEIFYNIMKLINNNKLILSDLNIYFSDGRLKENIELNNTKNYKKVAVLPWKLFELLYVPVDRKSNFIENIYPLIQKVNRLVKEGLMGVTVEVMKITELCSSIFHQEI